MNYLNILCITAVAIAGFNLVAVSPSAALEETDIEDSVLAPEEPDQSPNVSSDESVIETDVVETEDDLESSTPEPETDSFLLDEEDVLEPAIPLDY